eukprot:9113297-Ditylum_brightwellii.AAC.1
MRSQQIPGMMDMLQYQKMMGSTCVSAAFYQASAKNESTRRLALIQFCPALVVGYLHWSTVYGTTRPSPVLSTIYYYYQPYVCYYRAPVPSLRLRNESTLFQIQP